MHALARLPSSGMALANSHCVGTRFAVQVSASSGPGFVVPQLLVPLSGSSRCLVPPLSFPLSDWFQLVSLSLRNELCITNLLSASPADNGSLRRHHLCPYTTHHNLIIAATSQTFGEVRSVDRGFWKSFWSLLGKQQRFAWNLW